MTIAALFGAGVGWLEQEIGVHEKIMGRRRVWGIDWFDFMPKVGPVLGPT